MTFECDTCGRKHSTTLEMNVEGDKIRYIVCANCGCMCEEKIYQRKVKSEMTVEK